MRAFVSIKIMPPISRHTRLRYQSRLMLISHEKHPSLHAYLVWDNSPLGMRTFLDLLLEEDTAKQDDRGDQRSYFNWDEASGHREEDL